MEWVSLVSVFVTFLVCAHRGNRATEQQEVASRIERLMERPKRVSRRGNLMEQRKLAFHWLPTSLPEITTYAGKHNPWILDKEFNICSNLEKVKPLKKEPQSWQNVENRDIKVFSAFYERRTNADGPSIRIIAAGLQESFNEIGNIFCELWYENITDGLSVPALYQVIYRSLGHPDMWCSHFIICPLPTCLHGTPYAVSVTHKPCTQPINTLLVLNREPVSKSNTHALCISPLYNYFNQWKMIVEMFEIHKILGASEITIYNYTMTAAVGQLLDNYVNDVDENVNVIQWKWPRLKGSVYGQRAALNDCLYRMGHAHRYVTITDLDEIIVPRMMTSWPDLVTAISAPERAVYMFQHYYFRRNSSSHDPSLITQASFWRTHDITPPGKIRCKSMYNSASVISVDLHFAYNIIPGTVEYLAPPEVGVLHHYREEPMESFKSHPEKFHFIEDRHMERYKDRLIDAFNRRVNMIT